MKCEVKNYLSIWTYGNRIDPQHLEIIHSLKEDNMLDQLLGVGVKSIAWI